MQIGIDSAEIGLIHATVHGPGHHGVELSGCNRRWCIAGICVSTEFANEHFLGQATDTRFGIRCEIGRANSSACWQFKGATTRKCQFGNDLPVLVGRMAFAAGTGIHQISAIGHLVRRIGTCGGLRLFGYQVDDDVHREVGHRRGHIVLHRIDGTDERNNAFYILGIHLAIVSVRHDREHSPAFLCNTRSDDAEQFAICIALDTRGRYIAGIVGPRKSIFAVEQFPTLADGAGHKWT